jgi:hypothetical protein
VGYVRLKHTLSALALDALDHREARGVVAWLAAYCDRLSGCAAKTLVDGFRQPRSALDARGRTAPRQDANRQAGSALHALFEWGRDTVTLRPEFQPYAPYMDRQVHRLRTALAGLLARPGVMRRAAALFNNGLFFECHEFLEDIWRAAPAADRGFYHGVILIAAAFYHHEKGNLHGTRVKLRQGLVYLRPFLPHAHGVRLNVWMARLAPWQQRIDAGTISGVLAQDEIPKIPLTTRGTLRR